MEKMVTLTGQLICANQAELALVEELLPEHISLTRTENGCVSFDVVQTTNPLVWDVSEVFVDSDALAAHQKRAAESRWGQATNRIERRYLVTEN
ncbi:Antibiotic biosynthesis monooxygenase [Corynebacterium mustelae]|uniref:Antibiotic biosynthesis monooxygenase n=1 Tax=Corynebacterium mustelae TaxID=571915 RepID=A0A0G3H2X6_9CORY|nr:antibiotic biosynthesis monooxygenase [Corynebacterium mustelae]AKK05487.1 Antibiotic biosynthesis monooxygenase [Corynebacterium mustelae]